MSKNLFYLSAALMASLLGSSCSQDDAPLFGEDGVTTFSITLPADMSSRAFNSGTKATNLYVAVYEADGAKRCLFSNFGGAGDTAPNGMEVNNFNGSLTTTVKVSLVKDKAYDIICWAQSYEMGEGSPYTWNETDKSISVSYAGMGNYEEERDAFFGRKTGFISGVTTDHEIVLKRPFAQINLGTNDVQAYKYASGDQNPAFGMTITGASTTVNLADGTLSGEADPVTVALAAADTETGFPVTMTPALDYLAMGYVLPGAGLLTVDLNTNGKTKFATYNSVPSQTNFCTNIYGSLLTNPEQFTVTISPAFSEPANNVEQWDGVSKTAVTPTMEGDVRVFSVKLPSEFAWVAENASGTDKVVLNDDIDLRNHPIRGLGRASRSGEATGAFSGVIDGQGHTIYNFNSTSGADNYGTGLVEVAKNATVKNVNIVGGNLSSGDFAGGIVGCTKGGCTIENCHVENMTVNAKGAAAGIVGRLYGANDVIRNCTSRATVTGVQKVGGICAITVTGTAIQDCENHGAVSGGNDGVGGILGYANATAIKNCKNFGAVGTADERFVGGILGYVQSDNALIENCVNSGAVKGNSAGGIFGSVGSYQNFNITRCTNNGAVTGVSNAGGIASGHGTGTIAGCVNNAPVSATASQGFAAGIVAQKVGGKIDDCDGGTAAITAFGAARILANAVTGPDKTVEMSNIHDVAVTDIPTVFVMGPWTAWGQIKVVSGTLHGDPCADIGLGNNTLTISEGAGWDLKENPVGTWRKNKDTGVWGRI